MPPERTSTRKRRKHDENYESRLQKAKEGLALGIYHSISEAATKNNVARQTLSDRVNGTHKSRSEACESRQLLTPAQESAILNWCDEQSRASKPFGPLEFRSAVLALTGKQPGKRWYLRYEKRHPTFKRTKHHESDQQQPRDPATSNLVEDATCVPDEEMPQRDDEGDCARSDAGSVATDISDSISFASDDCSSQRSSSSSTVSINTICKRMEEPFHRETDKRSFAEIETEHRKLWLTCNLLMQERSSLLEQSGLTNPSHVSQEDDIEAKLEDPEIIASLKLDLISRWRVLEDDKDICLGDEGMIQMDTDQHVPFRARSMPL